MRNLIPISKIYIPRDEEERIRYKENTKIGIEKLIPSVMRFGQLQPILVERLDHNVHPDAPADAEWKLVDGQTRLAAIAALSIRAKMESKIMEEVFDKFGMKPDHIEATTREFVDPIMSLMLEFHANEDRTNFSFQEKAKYIRKVHDMLIESHGKEWTLEKTADYIGQSVATVSHYLTLTDPNNPATQDERVLSAKTKAAALKNLKIAEERNRRIAHAQQIEKLVEKKVLKVKDFTRASELSFYHGDAREWIKKVPEGSLKWFHWDPPYGTREGAGGAFSAHKGAQTDPEYCLQLILDMLPEIWRALVDGGWAVIWYSPVFYDFVLNAAKGHRFDDDGVCVFCKKHAVRDRIDIAYSAYCRESSFHFWVNPYPNVWRKTNRHADGHEITRFLTKETEFFLLICKTENQLPVLLRSDRGNVFDFPIVNQFERRHANHKPKELLAEILTLISVPGDIGGDAGAGSGSIIEAAYTTGRKVITAEIDDTHWRDSFAVGLKILEEHNIGTEDLPKFVENFGR